MDGYPPYANLVYDAGTMSWVRMTQPLVDSITSNLYLAVDQVESLLADIKDQQTTSSTTSVQRARLSGVETHGSGALLDVHVHNLGGHPALLVTPPPTANDAFGRTRVSDPIAVFDYAQEYNHSPYVMDVSTSSGGTFAHSTASASSLLTVNSTSGSTAILQSRQYHRYQPGKSAFVAMTFTFGAGAAGVTQRAGYFDADNGIFLELDGTAAYLTLRSSGSDALRIAQADWNVDPFDGLGPSGVLLDKTKAQILVVDLQWLGVGRVRAGFDIDGEILIAHEFFHANDNVGVYMRTANLPVRWEANRYSTASASSVALEAICAVVLSEGGFELDRGFPFAANAVTGRTVASRRAILSIRPKSTFNGLTTRGFVIPEEMEAIVTGSNVVTLVEVIYNPTFTGTPTWTSADAESLVEYSVHGDAAAGAFTGGTLVHSFLVAATAQSRAAFPQELFSRLALTVDIAGANPRALSLVGTDVTGNATMYGTVGWVEMR